MNWNTYTPARVERLSDLCAWLTLPHARSGLRQTGSSLIIFLALIALPLSTQAQQQVPIPQKPVATANLQIPVPSDPAFEVYPDYGSGNAIANKLRNSPVKLYDFDRASLRDVLRFMADDAGIPFVALQESSAAESTLVTFTLRASPFRALETIAGANGIQLFFENGIWFMRPINEQELIGRIYKLKYTAQQNILYRPDEDGAGSVSTSTDTASTPDLSLGRTDQTYVFEALEPQIIEQIKSLLGIATSGISAQMAAEASVGNFGNMEGPRSIAPGGSRFIGDSAAKGDSGAQMIYNSDSSTIYVVATRQQHQWVEGFMNSADRPQALIGIEVKFFETTRDPESEIGIDWAGTLEDGYSVTLGAEATASGGLDSGTLSTALNTVQNLTGGNNSDNRTTLNGVATTTSVDANNNSFSQSTVRSDSSDRETGFTGGYSAVLAPDDVQVTLRAFLQDQDTTTVQYPRMLTINNREVVIRSVINQPYLASASAVDSGGAGAISTTDVQFLPIGTIINVLPKVMPDDSVVLNVAITVSSFLANIIIENNPYPVTSARTYNAALQVDSGYTLAVGGIEQAVDQNNDNGIPYLKDIPGLGELFKSQGRSQQKRNLIIFITPTVIHDRINSSGISETPTSVLPARPGEPLPPAFTPAGTLVGGAEALTESIAWLQRQVQLFNQILLENRDNEDSVTQLESLLNTVDMLIVEIQRMQDADPAMISSLIRKEEHILALREQLEETLKQTRKNLRAF